MTRTAMLLLALLFAVTAGANEAVPTTQDPVAAARAVALAHRLRCLVCQNQSIADSDADLAKDLRRQIDEQIAAGRTDEEIIAFMTGRYGEFVLYKPPLSPATVALWVGPGVLLLMAVWTLRNALRRPGVGTPAVTPQTLTAEDRARAQALLGAGEERNE